VRYFDCGIALPRPLAGFKGPISKGREVEETGGDGIEGRGGEGGQGSRVGSITFEMYFNYKIHLHF